MTSSKSESKSKSKTWQFDFTELENELAGVNMSKVMNQVSQLFEQSDFQQAMFGASGPALENMQQQQEVEGGIFTPEEQSARLREQYERGDMQSAAGDALLQQQIARIQAGGDTPAWDGSTDLSDEQRDLINQNAASQLAIGESNIKRFGQEAIDMITQELAPSRGLRGTDTPIQDRAFSVGGEMARQQGNLANTIGAQSAQQMLQYPLQNAQMQMQGDQAFNQNAQFNQQLMQAAGDFSQNLQQQAFQNKLALSGQAGNLGLGGIAASAPNANLQAAIKPQLGTESSQKSTSGTGPMSISSLATMGMMK